VPERNGGKKLKERSIKTLILAIVLLLSINAPSFDKNTASSSTEVESTEHTSILTTTPSFSNNLTLSVDADATVDSEWPDDNFGFSSSLTISHYVVLGGDTYQWTYLKYDWGGLTFYNLSKAELHLMISWFPDAEGSTVWLYYSSNDSWRESGITWNNKPDFDPDPIANKTLGESDILGTSAGTFRSSYGNFIVDITDLVKSEEDQTITFVLTITEWGTAYTYSKEDIEGRGININKLILYFNAADIPGGLIDIDEEVGNKTTVYAELFHDGEETIDEYDFWAVRVTVEDPPVIPIYTEPFYVRVYLEMADWCEEFPANHVPQSGEYGRTKYSLSFSFYGIGFSVTNALYSITFSKWQEGGKTKMQWIVEPNKNIIGVAEGPVFRDYCQFGVGFRTPADKKPYVRIFAEVVYYSHLGFRLILFNELQDELWLEVDPPGADMIDISQPPTIEYPEQIRIFRINSFKISLGATSWEEAENTTVLKKGWGLSCWFNITSGLENVPTMVGVEVYDSDGQLVEGCWILSEPSWAFGTHLYGFGGGPALPNAVLGNGTIVILVMTNWPWKENALEIIPQITISIRIEEGW
jgi:hypothetical protein